MPYGPMFRKMLIYEKTLALSVNVGHFDASMPISYQSALVLQWRIKNMPLAAAPLHRHGTVYTLETDASTLGWGQTLMAALLVHLKSDNVTTVAYLQHFGGTKSKLLNSLAREIWSWCMDRNIWLQASHLPGTQNIVADFASRNFQDDLEWKLNTIVFRKITSIFGKPDIDLFASRLNFQVAPYATWRADPGSVIVDAFTIDWSEYACFYAFPPFCLIDRVLTKVEHDKAVGILIAPVWHTQSWFPRMLKLLVRKPCILPFQSDLLSLPSSDRLHPLRDRLKLMACFLSGKASETKAFQDELPKSSWHPGERVPGDATNQLCGSGFCSVLRQRLILFNHL